MNLTTSFKTFFYIFLFSISSLIFISGINNKADKNTSINKIKNLMSAKKNITRLILTEDIYYLKDEYLLAYKKYKILSKKDKCIQLFSDDNFFPYFLKKPTCTKFYLTNQILTGINDKRFIYELEKAPPNYILYQSPQKILLNYENFPTVVKHINDKYEFYENYQGYIFYKRRSTN